MQNFLMDQAKQQVQSQIKDEVQRQVQNNIKDQLMGSFNPKSTMGNTFTNQVKNQVMGHFQDQMQNQAKEMIKDQVQNAVTSQFQQTKEDLMGMYDRNKNNLTSGLTMENAKNLFNREETENQAFQKTRKQKNYMHKKTIKSNRQDEYNDFKEDELKTKKNDFIQKPERQMIQSSTAYGKSRNYRSKKKSNYFEDEHLSNDLISEKSLDHTNFERDQERSNYQTPSKSKKNREREYLDKSNYLKKKSRKESQYKERSPMKKSKFTSSKEEASYWRKKYEYYKNLNMKLVDKIDKHREVNFILI